MTEPAASATRTITLFQNKRIAVGERHDVDLAEFLSSPRRVDCNERELKKAKDGLSLWSPGTFTNNHRSRKTIENIFAVGFDLDEEPVVTFDLACTKLEFLAGHLMTSFRHRADAPRLRLIVLLNRTVDAEEYDRLWVILERRIAALGFGIGKAAKDPSRGWFVPAYYYEYRHAELRGTLINVDAELANDELQQERALDLEHVPRRAARGILDRARMYIDTWDPAIDGSGGSNVAFSHIERLVRGFDLTDEDALNVLFNSNWNKRCKPPWSKKELLHKIKHGRERGDTPYGELRDVVPIRPDVSLPSSSGESEIKLIYDKGSPAKIAANVLRIIERYPRKVKYNEFTDHVTWEDGKILKDTDLVELQGWLFEQPDSFRIRVSIDTIRLAVVRHSEDRAYHPVREYLRSLTWDNETRVERLFTRAFGAPDTDYMRAVSRCFMVGAVARVMKPGIKHDAMPVLEGAPGTMKSTALRTLASDEWFSDTPVTPGDKDAYQNLIGVWIHEHAELDSFSRARDVERIMAYLSSSKDHYRKSYGRHAEDVPRQSVFAGTTNKNEYLGDGSNGLNRRMWPVPCTAIDVDLIRDNRDQLWAEAVAMFDRHERHWLDRSHASTHAELAESRYSPDPWMERIAMLEPKEHTMGEVLMHCGVDAGHRTVTDEKRVSPLLRHAGWTPHQLRRNGIKIRFWVPPGFNAT